MSTPSTKLLELANSDPRRLLEHYGDPVDSPKEEFDVDLLHAAGVAYRNVGQLGSSVQTLQRAEALAHDAGDRLWLIRADLAASLAEHGEPQAGVDAVGSNLPAGNLDPSTLARVRHVQGLLSQRMGDRHSAVAAYEESLAYYEQTDNGLAMGHLHTNLGILAAYEGRTDRAISALAAARSAYSSVDQDAWVAWTLVNEAWVRGCGGQLPDALRLLSEAADVFERLGIDDGTRRAVRAEVLLKAGLFSAARDEFSAVVQHLNEGGHEIDRSEALILAAQAAELDGDSASAIELGNAAVAALAGQDRSGWSAVADATLFGIRCRADPDHRIDMEDIETLCERLVEAGHAGLVPDVLVHAAWAWVHQNRIAEARHVLVRADTGSGASNELSAMAALTRARILESEGRPVEAIDVLDQAFGELYEQLNVFGGIDVAALASAALVKVVADGKRLSSQAGPVEEFARWTDRGRQIATWSWPRLADPRLATLLNRARALASDRSGESGDVAAGSSALDQVKREIKELRWQLHRDDDQRIGPVSRTTDSEIPVIDVTNVDGQWFIIKSGYGEATQRTVDLDDLTLAALIRLGRLFQTSSPSIRRQLLFQIDNSLATFDRALAHYLPKDEEAPVFIGIDEALSDLPWSALPSLWDRPYSILPTKRYLAERSARVSSVPGVSTIVGPGLATTGLETRVISDRSARPPSSARMENLGQLSSILDRRIVHIAAHGGPEPDNPLFNWLEFDFGKVFLHDLMLFEAVPEVVILAACYAGQTHRMGAGGTASFANGFLAVGSRWVVSAGTAMTDDDALVAFAAHVLDAVADGLAPPVALSRARRNSGDRLTSPAAIAFTCFGG